MVNTEQRQISTRLACFADLLGMDSADFSQCWAEQVYTHAGTFILMHHHNQLTTAQWRLAERLIAKLCQLDKVDHEDIPWPDEWDIKFEAWRNR